MAIILIIFIQNVIVFVQQLQYLKQQKIICLRDIQINVGIIIQLVYIVIMHFYLVLIKWKYILEKMEE